MSTLNLKIKEPYLSGSFGVARNFLEDYRGNLVDFKIDSGVGNILVTGRPNSGVEDFKELLLKRLDETGKSYEEIYVNDTNAVYKALKAINDAQKLVIIEDPYRLLFSRGGLKNAQAVIYFTRHWNLKTDGVEYSTFSHHIAFASQRNQEIGEYPKPFAGIGSDLQKGEYISINTGQFSMVSQTSID